MRRPLISATVTTAAAIAAVLAVSPSTATGSSTGHDAWHGQQVASRAEAEKVTGANAKGAIVLTSTNGLQEFIDVGTPDFSPGDYVMLNLRLSDEGGEAHVGRGTVRCDFGFGTQTCRATFLIYGHGQITVDGVIYQNRDAVTFAVIGGTGDYLGAGGSMRIADTQDSSLLVLHLTR